MATTVRINASVSKWAFSMNDPGVFQEVLSGAAAAALALPPPPPPEPPEPPPPEPRAADIRSSKLSIELRLQLKNAIWTSRFCITSITPECMNARSRSR